MSKVKATDKGSILNRFMKTPMRVLIKFKNFYIQSMNECSVMFDYGTAMGCPTPQVTTLPRSFSASSTMSTKNCEDIKQLIRVGSARSSNLNSKIDVDLLRKKQGRQNNYNGPNKMPRSQSVGIGRIDEDKSVEFEDDFKVKTDVFPRCKSYAVSRRTMF